MVVVSTGLGREEWGSAEQELGLSVRGVGLSTFREREGPEAWGIGTGQDRKVDESRRGQVWRDWVRHPE